MITRLQWRVSKWLAWEERHELLADIITGLFMAVIFAVLFGLAFSHDAIWYDGLTAGQKMVVGGY